MGGEAILGVHDNCLAELWMNSTFGYLNTLGCYCVGKKVHACRIQQLKWSRGARHEKTSLLFMNLFTCNVIHAHDEREVPDWVVLVASRHDHDQARQIALFLDRWVLTENEFDHVSIFFDKSADSTSRLARSMKRSHTKHRHWQLNNTWSFWPSTGSVKSIWLSIFPGSTPSNLTYNAHWSKSL